MVGEAGFWTTGLLYPVTLYDYDLFGESPSDYNTFRRTTKNGSTKRTKEDEKEWLDSTKDAKQTGTNNKTLVPNWE